MLLTVSQQTWWKMKRLQCLHINPIDDETLPTTKQEKSNDGNYSLTKMATMLGCSINWVLIVIISMKIYGGGKTVLLVTRGGQRLALTVTSTPGRLRMRSQSCNVQRVQARALMRLCWNISNWKNRNTQSASSTHDNQTITVTFN